VRVLVADHEAGRAKALAQACLGRGHVVERAAHGAAALELALEHTPEGVVCPIDLPVIDGARLAGILRANPRTRAVSFVFLVRDELDAPLALDSRDATVVSPWSEDDVLDDLELVHERSLRFGEPRSEIEGELAQISLADLLQIFQMNQRSGTLRLTPPGSSVSALVALRGGQVIDALVPLTDGSTLVDEKALFRLLRWTAGRFEFLPGAGGKARITRSTRAVLLDGIAQRDEVERLRGALPDPGTRLRLTRPPAPESATEPGAAKLLEVLRTYSRIEDLVDHCPAADAEVLRLLVDWLARGLLERDEPPDALPGAALAGLLDPGSLRRLREWISAQRPRPASVLKVPIAVRDPGTLAALVELLRAVTPFAVDARLAREPARIARLGSLGCLPLGEGLGLRFIGVPVNPAYAPLWDVAAHGMLGAVALAGAGGLADARQVAAVAVQLRARVQRPVVPVAFGTSAEDSATRASLALLERAADASLVVLPAPGSPAQAVRAALCALLARLLP
jgi:CheY-like chemotaxis protein